MTTINHDGGWRRQTASSAGSSAGGEAAAGQWDSSKGSGVARGRPELLLHKLQQDLQRCDRIAHGSSYM